MIKYDEELFKGCHENWSFLNVVSNQNTHSFYVHFHFEKNTLWKNLSSQPLDMCLLWECVCVHAVVCTCVYLCAHPCGFTLKHKFFIAFKLPSHFYIVFTLISLFSLSERPALTVGKFSKNLLLPTPLKWWFLIALTFSAF